MAAKLSDPKTLMPPSTLPPPPHKPPLLPLPPPSAENVSLYVGDLDPQVTKHDLIQTFHFVGPIASVRLCRDSHSGESLCYAYVNFYSHSHASKAMACLNHTDLKGKTMRIMWSQSDPRPRKLGIANVFVKNLDTSINSTHLQEMFGEFGTILSCKVAEENGQSKGFGFVQFDAEDSAMAAINALNEAIINGKKLYVSKFVKKSERIPTHDEPPFTNLFMKNLDEDVTEDLLREVFCPFGRVCSLAIMKDDKGKSRGFGFVNFESQEEAKKAVEAMNGALLGSKHVFVGRAQKKAEREKLLKCKDEMLNSQNEKLRPSNLYVKNLAEYVDETRLGELFSAFGNIVSVKVMRHDNGMSRGFGYVCFSTVEEAANALDVLDGKFFEGRKLHVAVAQSKEDRCRALQNHYAYQLSQRSLQVQPPKWTVLHPIQYSISPTPPLLHQPVTYQTFGINGGAQYPFGSQNNPQHFSSWVPKKQAQWGVSTRNENFQNNVESRTYAANPNVHTQFMNYGNNRGQEPGFRKKGYKQSGPTGSSRGRALSTESTGNTKNPVLRKPGRASQIKGMPGMLLEMNNSDKAAQAFKTANGRTSADHRAVYAKCGRYLM